MVLLVSLSKPWILNIFKNHPEFLQNVAAPAEGDDARPQYGCKDADRTTCGHMLNTDFEVFYNMALDEDEFLSECDLSAATTDCEKSDTYDLSVSYAEVNYLITYINVKVLSYYYWQS